MNIQPRTILSKLVGILLILLAAAGVLLSLGGVVAIWQVKSKASAEIVGTLGDIQDTLARADESISTLAATLDGALGSLDKVDASLEFARTTMDTSTHFFDTAAELTGKTLPDTFTSMETALQSAASSAKVVDDSLNFISALPLVGGNYAPTVPLSEALSKVAKDVEPLAGTFQGIEDDVLEVKDDMVSLKGKLDETHAQIAQIKESSTKAKNAIAQTKELIGKFQPRIQAWRDKLPRALNILTWAATVFLLWLALSQLGLIVQGVGLLWGNGQAGAQHPGGYPPRAGDGYVPTDPFGANEEE